MAAAKKKETKTTTEFTTKKFKDFTISKKRSGRFLVTAKDGKIVNGADKTNILLEAKLVSAGTPKAKEEAAAT